MSSVRVFSSLTLSVLILLGNSAHASSGSSNAELDAITNRGHLLAKYDSAAWQATDAVMATHPIESRMLRYIARKTEAGWVVDFGRINATGSKFLVAYEATQSANPMRFEVRSFEPAQEDTGWDLAAAKGIETAMKDFRGADRPYNIAVLPAERGSMYVYLYPAQVKADIYPLGDDVRYRISPEGLRILERHQMHKSIIEFSPSSSPGQMEGGYHIHVLSDLPEDTDVMFVMTRKPQVPEIILAGGRTFTINVNGKITVADRPR